MILQRVLHDLYDSEINISISSDWDCGHCVQLGDMRNGFKVSSSFIDSPNVAQELIRMAIEHYPESEFSKKYSLEGA